MIKTLMRRGREFSPLILTAALLGGYLLMTASHGDADKGGLSTAIGGGFSLMNEDGKPVTEKDYAGKYLLVYFGFTSCPAICPTELQKMSEAYDALPKESRKKIQPLFISVDPERDTPESLKDYTDMFLPNLVGLTGSPEQIEAVKKAYKVYATKVPDKETYTVDHSSFIYLVTPDGKVASMFKTADKAEIIRKSVSEKVSP